jgi:glycine cleavage system aminomethyltransferase T/glycine/D-amino acid oxidase-like deaminating enzyme
MSVSTLPDVASAVVIGGGVIGASVAYHLARLGWSNVVLLERKQFGSGTSWHAAGLVGTMRANESHARLCEYSMSLLSELETETEQSTGFRQVGSLSIAHSVDRFEELKRVASMNNAFGVTRVDVVTPEEIRALHPFVETNDLLGGTWVAHDGMASPVDVVNAFIKGARGRGVHCVEGVNVTGITTRNGRVTGVETDAGDIRTDFVANCAGMWGRDLGRLAGVNVPLQACEHYYAHTEKIPNLPSNLPVLRDHDACAYFREDAGSLLVGVFEPNARPWAVDGIPDEFCFDELPGHFESQLMPYLEQAIKRMPSLENVGWRQFFCGPESFTPDGQFHLGQSPELRGFFVACGLNSVGIQSAGGLGKALSEWMDSDHAPLDLIGNDIRRMFPFQSTKRYLSERVSETLGLLYARHYPYRQYETARSVRTSPVHDRLVAHNACFGEVAGWERANWFAPLGVEPRYEYSFGKQNWFSYSAEEHKAARETVALFDQSSFSKYRVQGRDACRALQRICTANVNVEVGRIVYTHWLNERGGIEADLTVTRLAETTYLVVSAAASTIRDLDWLARNIDEQAHCMVTDVTAGIAVFGVMGPNSRALLSELSGEDLSNSACAFGSSRELEIGYARCRVVRVSFVGELGWEIYVPSDQARHVFDVLVESGAAHGLRLGGMHALDSGRIEKKFLHFGHDVGDEDTPLEAGVRFVCDFEKESRFIGYDALAKAREARPTKRLVQFLLQDPEVMLYQHEPILCDGKTVGYLTSGNYGHTLGGAVGLGYVHHGEGVTSGFLKSSSFAIDVAGDAVPAQASLRALYDPRGERVRG